MRFLVGAVVVIGLLLLPNAAAAQTQECGDICGLDVYFVQQYTRTDTNYYRAHVAKGLKDKGVRRRDRDEMKDAVYRRLGVERDGDNAWQKWCKKHQKACRAAIACIAAAATSLHKDINDNEAKDEKNKKSPATMTKNAAGACAIAAAIVYVGVP